MTARIQEYGDEKPGVLRWICNEHTNYTFGWWDTDRAKVERLAIQHDRREHGQAKPVEILGSRELWSALNDCWALLTHEQINDLPPGTVDLCRRAHTIIDHPEEL